MLRDLVQELQELGAQGTAFRVLWELKKRTGVLGRNAAPPPPRARPLGDEWERFLTFPDPAAVAGAMADRIPRAALDALQARAAAATEGRIRCFGRWVADYGRPIDWHLNPTNGQRWDARRPWAKVLEDEPRVGDVKLTWEVARFPQAFEMARAAAFAPDTAGSLGRALLEQFEQFTRENPYGLGVHWASGQETAIRLIAWVFALDVLLSRGPLRKRAAEVVGDGLWLGAVHIERHLEYARLAVYNNHLLYEALGLYLAGVLLGQQGWREKGRRILSEEAERQFYADGAYIQQSHNYHRSALQSLLCAVHVARAGGEAADPRWISALDRSLEFLVQHQNPVDGRLPNYGGNDGAMPLMLSTCDYSDFRPVLQAVSVLVRGERLYEPGPWDEAAAWWFGPGTVDLPLAPPRQRSKSFSRTGHHVLRGQRADSFAAFRCGSLIDRFSQIDMLHVDVWWRGLNVLADPGSYLYNGPTEWHDHFVRTASHNTVVVDGRDQMLHHRRFKTLYWTKARLRSWNDEPSHASCTGEHFGYARHDGGCVHRRSVLFVKDELWVVADTILGEGDHHARLHWLASEPRHSWEPGTAAMSLDTPQGVFSVAVYDEQARALEGSVVMGQQSPPRGWLSRYYAEKVPAPSLAVELEARLPLTLITVMGSGRPTLEREGGGYAVLQGDSRVRVAIDDGHLSFLGRTITGERT